MTWIKLDDQFPDHRKIVEVGPQAAWLHVCAICYCSRQLTDGLFSKRVVNRLAEVNRPKALAQRLVAVGLWIDRGESYEIHDYLGHQRSREEVEQERGFARRRAALNSNADLTKMIKERDKNRCRYCGRVVNWRDRKSPLGGSYDHVIPVPKGGQDSFRNLVVCCRGCNMRKGSKTPAEAGMPLLEPGQNLAGIKPESNLRHDKETETDTELDITPLTPLEKGGINPRANGSNPRAKAERQKQQRRKEPRVIQLADGTTYEAT